MPLAPRIVRASRATSSAIAHVVELADADLARVQLAGVLEHAEPPGQQLRLLQLEHHVDELALGELEAGDRPPVLHAGLGVLQRGVVAGAPGADRAPADAEARLGQAGQRPAHALDLRAAPRRPAAARPPAISSEVIDARSDSLRWMSRAVKPLRVGGDDEAADAVVGLRPHDGDVGDAAVGDPHLRPVEDPVVAVAPRAGAHVGRVGAEVGLGQPEAADRLAGRHPRQPLAASAPRCRTSRSGTSRASPAPRRAQRIPLSPDSSSRQATP